MKKLFIFSVLFFFFCTSFAQEADTQHAPDSIATPAKVDIEDETVMAMVNTLMETPLYENLDRIANLTQVFILWVIETDKVRVDILPYFADLTKTNSSLSIPYFCGWIKYAHENQWKKNDFPLEENIAAIESVITYYRKNEDKLLNDPYIIELEDKLKDGLLSDYLRGQIEEVKNAIEDKD